MELVGVRVEIPANTPMLLLQEQSGQHRLLPIYIGNPEATAIHYALEGIDPPRPLTHDLFTSTLGELGATLEQVVITEVRDHTYYAELHLLLLDGTKKQLSCRPSDAVALAVRIGAPIVASDELLDEVGQVPEEAAEESEEIIDEFKDFIENVTPDDFAS